MKIKLASHGGWTAGLRLPPITLDTSVLPSSLASEAEALATAAEGASNGFTASAGPSSHAPEAMRYEIIVERNDGEVRLNGSDVAASPEFEALRDWIQRQAGSGPERSAG